MKASMDGVRRNIALAYNELATRINNLDTENMSSFAVKTQRDAILEALGYLRQFVAFLLIVNEPDRADGDVTCMSAVADKLIWPKVQEPGKSEAADV